MLTTLTLNVKNFYISDIQEINAYIQIEDYDPQEPVNILYMAYYGRLLPGLGEKDRRMIHMGQIIDFFNRLKYSSSASAKPFLKGKTSSYAVSYQFPIVKGTYDVINKDPTIRVRSVSDNEITVERLCRFKGLARTDFRNLKAAEKQQRREETIVAENLTLFRMDDKSMTAYSAGQMMPYGIYALFEKEDHLGTVELVPCGKGGSCKEGTSQDPAVTLVKIFDHEFVLYKDVLDLIKRNHNRHGSDIAYDPAGNWKEFRRRSEGGEQKALRLFPGCVAPADVK